MKVLSVLLDIFLCVHMNRWMNGWKEEAVLIADLQSYDIKILFQKFPTLKPSHTKQTC